MITYDGKAIFRRTGSSLGLLDHTQLTPVVFTDWSEAVLSAVCEIFGVTKKELKGKSRRRKFAWPRQVGASLAYQYGNSAAASVGDVFGGRHYSWVYYSRSTVSKSMGRSQLTVGQVGQVLHLARTRFTE